MKRTNFRRKREGKTNYKKRLSLLLNEKLRLVIRKSLKNIVVQLVDYSVDGDKVVVGASSKELEKLGWIFSRNSVSASYLTGYLLGKKAAKRDIKEAVLDLGLSQTVKGGKLYSALKGVLDTGVKVAHSEEILPDEKKIKGNHIVEYAKKLSESGRYEKVFSGYAKKGIKAEDISKVFDEVKGKIN
jgi:large subunit ribosomal protein L18